MKSRFHRTHQYPFDKKLRKKKKFKKVFQLEEPILSREKLEVYESKAEHDTEVKAKLNFIGEVQMDDLCRGKQLRVRMMLRQISGVIKASEMSCLKD